MSSVKFVTTPPPLISNKFVDAKPGEVWDRRTAVARMPRHDEDRISEAEAIRRIGYLTLLDIADAHLIERVGPDDDGYKYRRLPPPPAPEPVAAAQPAGFVRVPLRAADLTADEAVEAERDKAMWPTLDRWAKSRGLLP